MALDKPRRRIITENDPKYRARLESDARLQKAHRYFGEFSTLRASAVRKLRSEDPARYAADQPRYDEILRDPYKYEKLEMAGLSTGHGALYLGNIDRLLSRIKSQQPTHPILDYARTIDGPLKAQTLIDNLAIVPESVLAGFFEANAEHCKQALTSLKERCELYRAEFIVSVRDAVADDYLAPDTDIELVERRAHDVLVKIIDPLHEETTRRAGAWDGTGIAIKPDMTPERERAIAFHELTHAALAGRKLVIHENRPGLIDDISEQKSGLQLRGRIDTDTPLKKWRWMNEALTENIAARLGGFAPQVYENERYALDLLLRMGATNGTPRDDFMRLLVHAYQENYQSEIRGSARLPRLKRALGEIRRHAGDWLDSIERILR